MQGAIIEMTRVNSRYFSKCAGLFVVVGGLNWLLFCTNNKVISYKRHCPKNLKEQSYKVLISKVM